MRCRNVCNEELSYIKMRVIISFLILILCVSENNGESTAKANFEIETRVDNGEERADCVLKEKGDVTVTEGSTVRLDVESEEHIQISSCIVESSQTQTNLSALHNKGQNQDSAWFLMIQDVTKNLSGTWSCRLGFGNPNRTNPDGYKKVTCKIKVNVQEQKVPDVTEIRFSVSHGDEGIPRCKPMGLIGPFQENEKILVTASSSNEFKHGDCFLADSKDELLNRQSKPFLSFHVENPKIISSEIKTLHYGHNRKYLICRFDIDVNDKNNRSKGMRCEQQLIIQRTPEPQDNDTVIIIVSSVVGVIVFLIIVGQTIALLYFKTRAQERSRLESLVTRDRPFDRNDEARYSAPPNRRTTKSVKATTERDSHIYEMVGVNVLYKESSEFDIKNRPPLPLPGESPVPPPVPIDTLPRPPKSKLMSSTLSLNSISSNTAARPSKKELPLPPAATMSKVPCRPPKPDKKLPGSLPRPPKPGSELPKMLPTDPALLELKKAIEKRNFGNASPSPSVSQQSTLEMKPKPSKPAPKPPIGGANPKAPIGGVNPKTPIGGVNPKTPIGGVNSLASVGGVNTKAPVGGVNTKAPIGGVNPLAPVGGVNTKAPIGGVNPMPPIGGVNLLAPVGGVNPKPPIGGVNPLAPNVKFLLPKMEASLRPPPAVKTPKTEVASPAPSYPGPHLPPPQGLVKPRPLPPQPEDDDGQYSDDEEWTYEQLEKYNIYNV